MTFAERWLMVLAGACGLGLLGLLAGVLDRRQKARSRSDRRSIPVP